MVIITNAVNVFPMRHLMQKTIGNRMALSLNLSTAWADVFQRLVVSYHYLISFFCNYSICTASITICEQK